MARFAISQEGADAMRQVSQNIISSVDGIDQSTKNLKTQIMGYMDDLGVYGLDIWAMTIQIDNILEDRRDALLGLAEKANRKSDEILEIVGGLASSVSQGNISTAAAISHTIGGVTPGNAMSFEQADSGNVNPDYGNDIGYAYNCQSCVATFEARLRGYNVKVLPNTPGSMLETLSHQPNLVWIDPNTGKPPAYIFDDSLSTPEEYAQFIDDTVKQGNRYTIQFLWKGRNSGGHIVNLDRNENGELRIKDNQRGFGERSEWLGKSGIMEYLSDVKFEQTIFPGVKKSCVPQILRIDNMEFNYDVASKIMEGVI